MLATPAPPTASPGIPEEHKLNLAFRAVDRLADALDLSWDERCCLLGIPRSTYQRWLDHGVKGDRDKHDRIAYLLAIYHLAGTAFPGAGGAKGWLTRPNTHPACAGRRPLDILLQGGMEDLLAVHRVLRAAEALWS
jgi:putative toxin-antitoxin system antitoxin component (TIGR02293 family)